MESGQWGPLSGVVVDSQDALPSSSPAAPQQIVVLLHGWGAPGRDLVGLARNLKPKRPTRFVFLQSPRTVDGSDGPAAGRAWWPLDMMQLQVKRMLEQYDELANMTPDGLDRARSELSAAVAALRTEHPGSRLYVGGFSQGSMLATDWVLSEEPELAGLIVLSGTTLRQETWTAAAARRTQRVFQSHSPDDPVLPLALAERFRDLVKAAGWEHTWVSFAGGHGIAPSVLAALTSFLDGEV